MRRACLLFGLSLLAGCASFGGNEVGRKYVVFFNKGASDLDAPAQGVVSVAAKVAARHPDVVAVVAGYAAAHGDPDADQALSAARATAVAAALQADGMPADHVRDIARAPANENPAVAARRVEIGFVSP